MKVSVCMIVYNHEKFIKEAIIGVLNQVVDFPVELIISNDNSSDDTHQVIQDVLANHSSNTITVKYFNHKVNKGMMPNFIDSLKTCKGEYIAFCEGDDYWIDNFKLKKQIEFLDHNPDYNISFHDVKIFKQQTGALEDDDITRNTAEITDVQNLVRGNYMHTPSVILRNNFKLPRWFSKSPIGDWTLYMVAVNDKKIIKLNDVMSVYRVHDDSVWSNKSRDYRLAKTLKCYKLLFYSKLFKESTKERLKISIDEINYALGIKKSFTGKLKDFFIYKVF